MQDILGRTFQLGDTVARAKQFGNSPILTIEKVTAIRDGKLYTNDSTQAIRNLDRLVILESAPLEKTVEKTEWPTACTNNKAQRLINALNEHFIGDFTFNLETRLKDNIEFDSLDLIEMIMAVEDEFGVAINDEEVENIFTVKDILELPQIKELNDRCDHA